MANKLMYGILLVGLAVLLIPGRSEAKTIEEILRDKGVITAAEYKAATEGKGHVQYQAGKGLTAVSADGNSSLHLGGWAQLLYRFTDYDAPDKDSQSDFDIRRFKLVLKGNLLSKNFGYKFQGDVSDGFRTEDVFVNYRFCAPLTLQIGQFKPPQARQELTSAARQLFPERSLANDTFNLGRDRGLQAAGSFAGKKLQYRLGIFNGNGPNTSNPDNHHLYAGRIDFNPLGAYTMDEAGWPGQGPLLNIGCSLAYEKISSADVGSGFNTDDDVMDVALNLDQYTNPGDFTTKYGRDLDWLLGTANLNASWLGAGFAAEYYHLKAAPSLGADWKAHGYYIQASYQVLPEKLELAARYTEVKSTDANASANFDKSQTQLGVNYYFYRHLAKLQSDITWVNDKWKSNQDDTIVRLQAQFFI